MVVEYLLGLMMAVSSIPFADKSYAIDVSHWNTVQDWNKVLNYNFDGRKIAGVFMKATEGTGYVDPTFNTWMNRVSQSSQIKVRGAYHFFRTDSTGKAQAEHFAKTVEANGHFNKANDFYVLDVESYSGQKAVTKAAYAQGILEFIDTLAAKGYKRPVVYVGKYYWDSNIGTAGADIWKKAKLWLPRYGANDGHVPSSDKYYKELPVGATKASFWQFTSNGKIDGVSGGLDLDLIGDDIAF